MFFVCKKTRLSVLFILILIVGKSNAQSRRNYSLRELIDSAQRHLPILLQKRAYVDAARAGIVDARHTFLPSALVADQLNIGTDNSTPGSYLSFGVIPSTSSGIKSSNDYQSAMGNIALLQSNYELVDFGLKKAKINNAMAYADFSQADLDKETYLLKWQVGKLYFDILKNQFQLAIDGENVTRYVAIYRVIQAITQSGIKAGADSSLAMAELSKSRITYNQTDGAIKQLQQQMSYFTGLSMGTFDIDTAQIKNYLAALDSISRGGYPNDITNPLIDYYAKQESLYKQNEILVKKSYLPKIFLTASGWARGSSIDANGNYNALTEGIGYQRFNYLVGGTFVYDLFNTVHRRDKLAISQYNTLASDFDLRQQELSLINVRNQADEGIHTAVKNLLEIPIQINASEDTYNQKIAQYKAGIINLIDLTNASFVLYRAQSDFVQTLSDWLLANLDKAASSGNLDLYTQSFK